MEITEEELNQKIQDAVDAASKAITAQNDAETKGIKAKNAELIAAQKTLKDAADEAETAKAEASGDIEAMKASHAKALEKIAADRDAALAARDTLMIDNVITSDLATHNVSSPFRSVLTQAWKAQAKVQDGVAMIDGQPIADFIRGFVSSDEGKHYVAAPANSGAGAPGSTRTSTFTAAPKTAAEFQAFGELANRNPAEANALADSWGMPSLKV